MRDRLLDIIVAVILAGVFFALVCWGLGVLVQ